MRTTATVVSVDGELAIVQTKRTSACEGCHKSADGGCSVCTLMGGEGKPLTARADNRIGAKVGDFVIVESETRRMIWYAALVFFMPLLAAFCTWWIASALTSIPQLRFLGAAIGFALAFVGLRIYSAVIRKRQADVVITEIQSPAQSGDF